MATSGESDTLDYTMGTIRWDRNQRLVYVDLPGVYYVSNEFLLEVGNYNEIKE